MLSVNDQPETSVYSGAALSWTPPSAKPDGTYTYRLQTCSGSCGSPGAAVTGTVATEIPGALDASPNPNTTGSYTVSWNAVTSAAAYRLEEKAGAGAWSEIQVSSSRTRVISGKPVGTYQYRVRACRHATDVAYCGAFQAAEDVLTVQVFQQPPTIPAAPGSISGSPNPSTDGNYTVTWSASEGATSYQLQEKYCYGDPVETCETTWRNLTTTSGRTWSPPTPKTGYGKYFYQVKACNTAGCSAYRASSAVKVQLPNVLPERMSIGGMASPNPSTNGIYTVSWSASARATRYELQEMSVDPTWVTISTTLTGTSWTPPTPKANGYYYYRGRACNVYGCSEYSVSSQTAVVQIPAPVTTPTGFRVMGSGAVNQAYKFFWDPVSGASHYNLKEEQYSCPAAADAIILIPANEAQPYKLIGWVPPCNGQPRTSVTYWYSLQACNGSACSGWTPTVMYTVTDGPPLRPAGSTTTYVHTDGLRSPIATTNELKAVTLRMRYEPYGAPTNGIHPKGPGYAGHVEDASTGLVYMQQRYYDPLAGRFLSTDPIAASAASFNRYWYANNNPYKNIDPDGRETGAAYSAMYNYEQGNYPQSMSAAEMGAIVDFLPVVGDIKGFVDAYNEPSFANIAAAVVGLGGPIGDAAGKGLKTGSHILKGSKDGERAGKAFTQKGKAEIDAANAERHGGANVCESCGKNVVPGQKSEKGVTPPGNERQRDHIIPKSKGGDGDPSNGQILCRNCNLDKSDKTP